jgi:SSS family solute:Na+ symporter
MGLNLLDIAIITAYLTGVTLFGRHFQKRQNNLKGYFLAGRTIPWWAIALSIAAAETSTLTIISVPGMAYESNFGFLQLVFGYMVGRIIICVLLIPHYLRGDLVTAYQLIERRFGNKLRTLTAGLFLVMRAAAEGVRVLAIAIVVAIALSGLLDGYNPLARDVIAIAIVTVLTLLYSLKGGMEAVIWTDVVQLCIYVTGSVVGLITILHLVPGGWHTVSTVASAANKFQIFDFSFNFHTTYTFWSGIIGGAFLTTATHGTDQLFVQRLLSSRSASQARGALLGSGVIILFQFTLFLFIGAMLYAFYKLSPPAVAFARSDTIFPTFVVSCMPHGISGLLISAILAAAMSNLGGSLYSLSSTTMVDFYLRVKPDITDQRKIFLSRITTVVWALVLFALAIAARGGGKVLEVGLAIASVAYGSLLGVFLLGVLTKRTSQAGAMLGMLCGFLMNIYLWVFTKIPYTWYVVLGSMVTFAVGYSASFFLRRTNGPDVATTTEG